MSEVAYAAIAKNERGRLQSATGYQKASQALIHLTDIWCLPGIVLQITDDGEVRPVYRLARNGVIFEFEPYPVTDVHGGAYCPKCHAAPGTQEPQYSGHGEGLPYATGVFRCTADECGNVYRPVPLP
jgi:hypothetical protein